MHKRRYYLCTVYGNSHMIFQWSDVCKIAEIDRFQMGSERVTELMIRIIYNATSDFFSSFFFHFISEWSIEVIVLCNNCEWIDDICSNVEAIAENKMYTKYKLRCNCICNSNHWRHWSGRRASAMQIGVSLCCIYGSLSFFLFG